MKLYANINSERQSKKLGKGGNEYIDIEILNEDQKVVATIRTTPEKDGKVKMFISNNLKLADIVLEGKKKCECTDPLCAKCLLMNCQDDDCKVHPLTKKDEFREMYKKR